MKDIIESLKIRFNNPFLISFIISWPFWNWKIAVGLLKYNAPTIQKYTGCNNFIEFIEYHLNFQYSFLLPFVSAIGYILLSPLVKYGSSWYTAKITAEENAKLLKISGKHPVDAKMYLEAVEESNNYIKKMTDSLAQKAKFIEENSRLVSINSNLDTKISGLENEVNILNRTTEQLHVEITKSRELADMWNNRFIETNSELRDKVNEVERLKMLNDNYSTQNNESDIKLEYYDNLFLKASDKILDGSWNCSFYVPERGRLYNLSFEISNKNLTKLKSDSDFALKIIRVRDYYWNSDRSQSLMIFDIELDVEKFNSLPDDIKDVNEDLLKQFKESPFSGQLSDDGNNVDMYNNSGIQLLMNKTK